MLERGYPVLYPQTPFVSESQSALDDLRRLGVSPNRITRIPPGVSHDEFEPGRKSSDPQIIYFAGLREYKRPGDVLLAFHLVLGTYPSASLKVVGHGPYLSALERLAASLGVSANVRFLGRLDTQSLSRAVASSWLNVNASLAEGWGFTVLEAAAAGVPSAGYRVPGIQDSILDGRTGILATSETPKGLAEAMIAALDNVATLSEAAWRFSQDFDWDKCADSWESHLSSIGPTELVAR